MEENKSEIKSSEIRELLNETPSWFVKWGTGFILLTVLSIVAVSWFIRFPDIVTAPLTVTTANPPIPVLAKSDGIFDTTFVKEGEIVNEGDKLAVFLRQGTNYEDIEWLEFELKGFNAFKTISYSIFENHVKNEGERLELGEINAAFERFIDELKSYQIEEANQQGVYSVINLRDRITKLNQEIKEDKQKIPLMQNTIKLKQQLIPPAQKRYAEKKITQEELEEIVNDASKAETDLIAFKADIQGKRKQIETFRDQLELFQQTSETGTSLALNKIDGKKKELINAIESWKNNYLLTAPVGGVISFYEQKEVGKKFFEKGDKVLAVVTEQTDVLVGKLDLNAEYYGKVKTGNAVLMRFSAFPHQEYGKIRGEVSYISKIPNNNIYSVEVKLNENNLQTTSGKTIPFERQLVGTAEIVTENKQLFQRIYERVF